MNNQFITILEYVAPSYQLTTLSLHHIVSLQHTNPATTVITLTDGRVLEAAHTLQEIHELIADRSRVVPSALKIFDMDRATIFSEEEKSLPKNITRT
ncbi:hypothetical protein [Spirosoma sp.]|uniref:hypothetical protein n=1 Tax=Spirosoma sp. TaxID=1899569 RepID=UPI00262CA934|nr:hypothetical protein [Spirosoma sp.]MCX6216373.1 hypothetical protein [Spirosoma sp.]